MDWFVINCEDIETLSQKADMVTIEIEDPNQLRKRAEKFGVDHSPGEVETTGREIRH